LSERVRGRGRVWRTSMAIFLKGEDVRLGLESTIELMVSYLRVRVRAWYSSIVLVRAKKRLNGFIP